MQASVWRRGGLFLGGTLLLLLALATPARADEVTTLSGTTYREIRLVRVEPDGVTWTHATGACKVDFTDLPEAVRRTYHYDARQAAAYQSAQVQARQQAAERTQANQREVAASQARRLQGTAAPTLSAADTPPGTFVYRRRPAEDADVRAVGEDIAAKTAAHDWQTRDDGTIWDRRLWAVPCAVFGHNDADTSAHPLVDPDLREFQGNLHHAPGGFAVDCNHDPFLRPDYLTKAYYKDVERAEAFARNRP